MPRRPKRNRAAQIAASLPEDDRFAPHPQSSIDVVYVMGRAAHLVGARFKVVVAVMLASIVISTVLVAGAVQADVLSGDHPQLVVLTALLAWAFGLLLQTPLVGAAIEVHTERRGLSMLFLRRGLARLGRMMVASVLMLLIVAVVGAVAGLLQIALVKGVLAMSLGFVEVMIIFGGSVGLLLLAMRIISAFSLAIPVILVENLGATAALLRSWQMGWRNGTSMYLALLLPALLAQFIIFLASFMPLFISIPTAVVLLVALALYDSAVVPVSYVVIREYVEGLDPAKLIEGLGKSKGAGPSRGAAPSRGKGASKGRGASKVAAKSKGKRR